MPIKHTVRPGLIGYDSEQANTATSAEGERPSALRQPTPTPPNPKHTTRCHIQQYTTPNQQIHPKDYSRIERHVERAISTLAVKRETVTSALDPVAIYHVLRLTRAPVTKSEMLVYLASY